ncbi:MAG: hypothetical protein M3Y85_09045 [Bacteroidota bacterium]|nr:hypothetical protein [Bacteroidota bacterium]
MNIKIGNHQFMNVAIPLLWGGRAVLQDQSARISVIDLTGIDAKLEILGDKPAEGIEYSLNLDGSFSIFRNNSELYKYHPKEKQLHSTTLRIPDCQITPTEIKIGASVFSGNTISGSAIGLFVDESGFGMGAPMPRNLAKLAI